SMKVLAVIDMRNDFISGALGTAEAAAIVPKVADKLARHRASGGRVVFTRDTHSAAYLNTQEGANLPVVHCVKGTDGWQICAALEVDDAPVVDKPTFGSLELAEVISAMDDVTAVELVGLCTDICVISNAMILKARLPEIPISVDAACCAGVTPESHENALQAMRLCQVAVV
ncbi:MAG: isochorismatase family cysteine hydrolase, partial [Pseudoflavonifractor sp.]